MLAVRQDYAALTCGSVVLVNEGPFITIDDRAVVALRIEDGSLLLSIKLDDQNGNNVCTIVDNEWSSGNPFAWDIEADWEKLVLRQAKGIICLNLQLKTIPITLFGEFWGRGHRVQLKSSGITIDGLTGGAVGFEHLGLAGIPLSVSDQGVTIGDNGGGIIVSWPDPRERLWKTVEAWRSLKSKRPL